MRAMICGATGLLGPFLVAEAKARGFQVIGVSRRSAEACLDLTNQSDLKAALAEIKPDLVVNAAALTDIELCEKNRPLAEQINCHIVQHLAECLPSEVPLVQISTDQVYPDTAGPHQEDVVGPVNVYGLTKLHGESAASSHRNFLILRLNIFGASRTERRTSLSDFVVKACREQQPITLFRDVLFSPLRFETAAKLIYDCYAQNVSGIFNLGSRNGFSKADFALAIAKHFDLPTTRATIGNSDDIPHAPRPHDLRMDVEKIEKALGRRMPTLEQEILSL